jgi:DNA replication and repair protein RecF
VILASLALGDFRGYADLRVDLDERLTVLVGGNAQGKTNFLRAVEVLGMGDAGGMASDEIVRHGAAHGAIDGCLNRDGMAVKLRASLSAGEGTVRLSLNGKAVTRPRWVGRLPVLFVGPEDRSQVTGPPSARRALLDELLEQCEPKYLAALREYRRALRQRNRALSRPETPPEEIEIWEEPLARSGGVLLAHRVRALAALAPRAVAWHRELAGGAVDRRDADKELSVQYVSSVECPAAGAGDEEWGSALLGAFAASRDRERAFGSTITGPHRDEVSIALAGRALKGSGSSGEIWSAILALAFASAEYLGQRLGFLPLMLLDDVLSALDRTRQDRLLGMLHGLPQALLTTTHVAATDALGVASAVYQVRQHRLVRLGRQAPSASASKGSTWEHEDRALCARC